MNNAEYHADLTRLSSSALKTLLRDPAKFHREYILGEREQESKPAFIEGSYTHTLILEPEKLDDYAVWTGLRRAGKAYQDFVIANPGKQILSSVQKKHGEMYYEAHKRRADVLKLLTGGIAEFTMYGELLGAQIKVRADYINIDQGYIVDVKTTALPSDVNIFKNTVSEFDYDLSAALYCKIAEQVYGKPFDFYWDVISKCDLDCQPYKMGEQTREEGASKVYKALHLYNRCKASGIWKLDQPRNLIDNEEILEV